jgi:hypothetical protein
MTVWGWGGAILILQAAAPGDVFNLPIPDRLTIRWNHHPFSRFSPAFRTGNHQPAATAPTVSFQ